MSRFADVLEKLLQESVEGTSISDLDLLSDEYTNIVQRLDRVKAEFESLLNDLNSIKRRTLDSLAVAARTQEPDINISVGETLTIGDDDQSCVIPSLGKCVYKREIHNFPNPADLADFVLSVVVPECKNGSGRIVIEGKNSTYLKLMERKEASSALC